MKDSIMVAMSCSIVMFFVFPLCLFLITAFASTMKNDDWIDYTAYALFIGCIHWFWRAWS